ncbi:hypothetical protein D9611_015030 [Ephemerocybe angulata]|uniref:Uncharacterized protein n=1 Tax=Ephemerocybe angulata TaxID=980116 RepID=A0A8H5C4F7_9AGAR|nr:hypothetical protein D9611_010006 [Tulosesus angulatus]KAF5337687.1 hypothetical protein D9611_015030 [Tulosesus angulatus]
MADRPTSAVASLTAIQESCKPTLAAPREFGLSDEKHRAVSKQVKHSRLTALTNDRTRTISNRAIQTGRPTSARKGRYLGPQKAHATTETKAFEIRDLRNRNEGDGSASSFSKPCSTCDESHSPLGVTGRTPRTFHHHAIDNGLAGRRIASPPVKWVQKAFVSFESVSYEIDATWGGLATGLDVREQPSPMGTPARFPPPSDRRRAWRWTASEGVDDVVCLEIQIGLQRKLQATAEGAGRARRAKKAIRGSSLGPPCLGRDSWS